MRTVKIVVCAALFLLTLSIVIFWLLSVEATCKRPLFLSMIDGVLNKKMFMESCYVALKDSSFTTQYFDYMSKVWSLVFSSSEYESRRRAFLGLMLSVTALLSLATLITLVVIVFLQKWILRKTQHDYLLKIYRLLGVIISSVPLYLLIVVMLVCAINLLLFRGIFIPFVSWSSLESCFTVFATAISLSPVLSGLLDTIVFEEKSCTKKSSQAQLYFGYSVMNPDEANANCWQQYWNCMAFTSYLLTSVIIAECVFEFNGLGLFVYTNMLMGDERLVLQFSAILALIIFSGILGCVISLLLSFYTKRNQLGA